MTREPRWWRATGPDRWCWPPLVTSPSSYLLVVSVLLTMIVKLKVVAGLRNLTFWPGSWVCVLGGDLAFFFGLAALLALGERSSRRVMFATVPIAILVTVIAVINAGYMAISGEQLTWQVLMLGLSRFGDVGGIVKGTVSVGPLVLLLAAALLVAPPLVARWALRRAGKPATGTGGDRARAAATVAIIGLVLHLASPVPRQYALQRLRGNAVLRTYWGLATGSGDWTGGEALFGGYRPRELVSPEVTAALRAGTRPNVVVVIMESTRRDETTLARDDAPAKTPNLVALGARGLQVTNGRAVIPQTSKSVWSMMCGRIPLLQTKVFENTSSLDVQCVPQILDAAGWKTGFFQSAAGTFEDRPRLVHELGYREFTAADHITDDLLGYLATEEHHLVAPILAWIDQAAGQPFFATVLTSATHHPYLLAADHEAALTAAGARIATERDRYDRQVEAADQMVGDIVAGLAQRNLLEHTIIVVLGDHGEGFGDKGVKQHGSNFFEEGLHVPWVMAGPGVPIKVQTVAASLYDLAPTLLDALGIALTPAAAASTPARSLLGEVPADRVLPFSCFYDNSCRGYVQGTTKVVYVPETSQRFAFDLAADPEESNPIALTDAQRATLEQVQGVITTHRAGPAWPMTKPAIDWYPRWKCPEDTVCTPINPLRH